MAHARMGFSVLLLAGSFFVLTVLASFSVSQAVSFPLPLYECKKTVGNPTLTWCEDMHNRWFKGTANLRCEGRYKDSGKPTKAEFAMLLERHAKWLVAYAAELPPVAPGKMSQRARQDPRRANLCGADLRDSELRRVDLRGADLQGVNLAGNLNHYKDLTGINLTGADLTGAILIRTFFKRANLDTSIAFADLCGAQLQETPLGPFMGAYINRAYIADTKLFGMQGIHLCGTTLNRVDLRGVSISRSILNHASLIAVDLEGATLQHVGVGILIQAVGGNTLWRTAQSRIQRLDIKMIGPAGGHQAVR
jgi:uncharacterized protein YjbI with pentapeptide repeats